MSTKRLYRSVRDKKLAGDCGGVAEYFNIDPTIVRILWLLCGWFFFPVGVTAYIIGAIVVPKSPY